MTDKEINRIIVPDESIEELIETHISWVLIGSKFVYKIKKPVTYSFVDFSTLEKRKYYCEEEIRLNNRLTENMYLDVVPIYVDGNEFQIRNKGEKLIDYAVKMYKQNKGNQMHMLLEENKVKGIDIIRIAQKISDFHKRTTVIEDAFSFEELNNTFNDIKHIQDFIFENYGIRYSNIILNSIAYSSSFIIHNTDKLMNRVERKMIRDCHGDLHSGNIFIEEEPVIFDCIEFNPSFRQIDLLYEIAFFCMDLDSFGRKDLSKIFLAQYKFNFPEVIKEAFDDKLLIFYKLLRANIKVKVLALKIQQHMNDGIDNHDSDEIKRYLRLMHNYHFELINFR